jgi:RNA polymerase sigma factor (sigma-70 family)
MQDVPTFEGLYQRRFIVTNSIRRKTGCRHDVAEDASSHAYSVYLEVEKKPEKPMEWLVTVGAAYVVSRWRSAAYNRELPMVPKEDKSGKMIMLDPADMRESAEPDDLPFDMMPRLLQFLTRLDARLRDALTLKFWRNASMEQMGERLGVNPSTASRRVERGLQLLRVQLGVPEPREVRYQCQTAANSFKRRYNANPELRESCQNYQREWIRRKAARGTA